MEMLAVQSLLLILAAFFAGAMIACFARRVFFVRANEHPSPDGGRGRQERSEQTVTTTTRTTTEKKTISETETSRFGRALTGTAGAGLAVAGMLSNQETSALPGEKNSAGPVAVDTAQHPEPAVAAAPDAQVDPADTLSVAPAAPVAEAEAGEVNHHLNQVAGSARKQDNLTLIRSIDQKTAEGLGDAGVRTFAQIAQWKTADVARINRSSGFVGRVQKENWIEQAQILSKGGHTDYALRRLESEADTEIAAPPPVVVAPSLPSSAQAPAESAVRSTTPVDAPQSSSPSDVAMLRSVRSEMLLGTGASEGVDNVFRLPTTSGSDVDDLKRIRGIGVLIEKKLNAMGVRDYAQIANWTAGDVARVSETLDFKGRIERESWIEQARILASGGYTEFSRRG